MAVSADMGVTRRVTPCRTIEPMALAVIGGLALSTPVTLLMVPGLYAAIKGRGRVH